jgi:hypothetical protein
MTSGGASAVRLNHPRRELARSIGVCPAFPPTPSSRMGGFFDRYIWPDFRIFRVQRQPFLKPWFCVRFDRLNRAFRLTDPTVDAFVHGGLLLLLLMLSRRVFLIGASHYFFNDSLLSSHFHHLRGGFWGVDCPFGGSGGVGPFGVSGTGWPFGALGVDWPFGVLGGLRPRDFGIHYSGKNPSSAASLVRTPIHTPPLLAGQFDLVGRSFQFARASAPAVPGGSGLAS